MAGRPRKPESFTSHQPAVALEVAGAPGDEDWRRVTSCTVKGLPRSMVVGAPPGVATHRGPGGRLDHKPLRTARTRSFCVGPSTPAPPMEKPTYHHATAGLRAEIVDDQWLAGAVQLQVS